MPRIKLFKTEASISYFGKYLTLNEYRDLKKLMITYFKALNKLKREYKGVIKNLKS